MDSMLRRIKQTVSTSNRIAKKVWLWVYIKLTLSNRVLLEKPRVARLVKKFPKIHYYVQNRSSLGPHPEPGQSSILLRSTIK
jgi:hypothetical protein